MQRALEAGLQGGALRRDPYAKLIEAYVMAIGLLPRALAAMRAAAQPVTAEQWEQALRRLDGVARKAFDKAATGVQGQASRRATLRLALAGVMAAAALVIAGYALGRAETQGDVVRVGAGLAMELGAGRAWEALIRANPDPRRALEGATVRSDQRGRAYYDGLALWRDAPGPPRP